MAEVTNQGDIETGVWTVFAREGIRYPSTALEFLAIALARRLDAGVDDSHLAAVSRELRLALEGLPLQPRESASSGIDKLIDAQ